MKIADKYTKSKSAKVGTNCICPSCNSAFVKQSYQQAFCKTKGGTVCKDKYWNTVDPSKRNNTDRVSPASQEFLDRQAIQRGFPDHETRKNHIDDSDGTWEAHQCLVENCEWCGMKPEYCECEDILTDNDI